MRILYIHQYFKTPAEGGAIRSYYISTALAQAGHEVVMITSHNEERYARQEIEGVDVHYLPVYYSNSLSKLGRSRAFLRFLRKARHLIDQYTPFDICYVSSTPLTVGLLALYARQRYRISYIFEVRDLWPEAPVQLGYIRNTAIKSTLRKLEKRLYEKASAVVALSPGIKEGINRSYPPAKVHLIPNMADCQFFRPEPKNTSLATSLGLGNSFVIGYFGAAGDANHLEYLLHAAQACQLQKLPVMFLVAAAGSRLEALRDYAREIHLHNIVFTPYGSKQQVKNWLSITDAVYTSFGPQQVLQTNSPNKFFDGLAAGKLSIVNTRGWLKELTEQYECGFYADPQDPEAFVSQLKPFLEDPARLQAFQQNARQLAEQEFAKEKLLAHILRLVTETVQV